MPSSASITREYLLSILDYDPETGVFTWRWRDDVPPICNHRDAGKEAGTIRPTGYRFISIKSRHWAAHRLAYIIMTGEMPSGDIDHINLQKADNRWCNLRSASRSENRANIGLYRSNTSGLKGVSFHKRIGKWQATVQFRKEKRNLGYFLTKEEAAKAREAASLEMCGEFHRTE